MTRTRKAAEETAPKPKKLKFKGLDLDLPAELPETLMFDFTEIEAAEGNDARPLFRLLRSILGPAQFTQIRNALDNGKIKADDITDLIEAIFDKYGMAPGE